MFRFLMPNPTDIPDINERKALLNLQMEQFLKSDPLNDLCSILDASLLEICNEYDIRAKSSGQVIESQEIKKNSYLEEIKKPLFPIFRELGFFDINKPFTEEIDHIIILGGSYNACYNRTLSGIQFLTDNVKSFDGIACYRPINPIERENSIFVSNCETEFGAMYDAFVSVLNDPNLSYTDDFHGDRNLHRISCIRTINLPLSKHQYRVYAAPSSEPGLRRANTFDSLAFYLNEASIKPGAAILAITNNIHCNRQLLQLVHYLLQNNLNYYLDVVGCSPDSDLPTSNTYDPAKYMQELVSVLNTINSIKAQN